MCTLLPLLKFMVSRRGWAGRIEQRCREWNWNTSDYEGSHGNHCGRGGGSNGSGGRGQEKKFKLEIGWKNREQSSHMRNEKIWAQVAGRAPAIYQVFKDIKCPDLLDLRPITVAILRKKDPSIWNLSLMCHTGGPRLSPPVDDIHCCWKLTIIRAAKCQVHHWINSTASSLRTNT